MSLTNADAAHTPEPLDPGAVLRRRFAAAVRAAFPEANLPEPSVTIAQNAKFGDYQCSNAMAYAKALGTGLNPRQVAQAIVERLDLGDLAEPVTAANIAGPGFINVTIRPAALGAKVDAMDVPSLGIEVDADAPVTVVDLCGVNLAKQMHIGHLRSTVIGDTLARVLERTLGAAKVKRQNHVGDWGLPIAMVTAKLMSLEKAGKIDLGAITLDDLDRVYKQAKAECEADVDGLAFALAWGMGPKVEAELEAFNAEPLERSAEARRTLVALQNGDGDVRRVWKRLYDVTMSACLQTCARLNANITEAHSAGESSYEERLAPLVAKLKASGVAVVDDGALVVRLEDAGIAEPCIVQKRDGGFLYATTDLAAISHRVSALGASRIIYCVDARQSLHFRQVFAAARKAGLVPASAVLEHAAFGTILGEDNRPFKSRSGESVRLGDVIDEAVEAARGQLAARSRDLPEAELETIARGVALAAIRYTDLSSERTKDYVFSLQRMVAFEGDTGPYLLYALARVNSILRNAAEQRLASAPTCTIEHAAEKSLALALLRYPACVQDVARTLEPHRLCAYLYELAVAFGGFFEACPVLRAETAERRASRLRLCTMTKRVLTDGLGLLGIPAIERM
ncbi:MAG: arginine--tRNA ligase [Phycisphaerales bacterium]|nr:arginine--tRNA ligase [Phycisphaerales bacterium]